MTTTFQISFHAFPEQDSQSANDGADTWLPGTPYRQIDADDEETFSDAAVELADWALETCPTAFGLAGDDQASNYEAYNDASIEMARKICEASSPVDATPDPRRVNNPHAWPKWFKDVELATGVVVRVDYFDTGAAR